MRQRAFNSRPGSPTLFRTFKPLLSSGCGIFPPVPKIPQPVVPRYGNIDVLHEWLRLPTHCPRVINVRAFADEVSSVGSLHRLKSVIGPRARRGRGSCSLTYGRIR